MSYGYINVLRRLLITQFDNHSFEAGVFRIITATGIFITITSNPGDADRDLFPVIFSLRFPVSPYLRKPVFTFTHPTDL